MRRFRVIFDRQRPSVVDLRCPPAAVGRSEALCTNRPYSVDLRSALKQTRRSRVVLGASQICADLGSCGTAAPGNADFGSSPVSMRRFRGSPSAGAEQRRSGVSFARRADLGSFLRICADPGFIPINQAPEEAMLLAVRGRGGLAIKGEEDQKTDPDGWSSVSPPHSLKHSTGKRPLAGRIAMRTQVWAGGKNSEASEAGLHPFFGLRSTASQCPHAPRL